MKSTADDVERGACDEPIDFHLFWFSSASIAQDPAKDGALTIEGFHEVVQDLEVERRSE